MPPDKASKVEYTQHTQRDEIGRTEWHGGPFTIVRYTYAPGAVFKEHSHDSAQVTTVLEGRIVFETPSGEIELGSGDSAYFPPNSPHGAHVPPYSKPVLSINIFTPPRKEHP